MVSRETDVCWAVWVGGLDCHFDGKTHAISYAEALLNDGYDDVVVVRCDECDNPNRRCADCGCSEPPATDGGWAEEAPDFRLCFDCSNARFLAETGDDVTEVTPHDLTDPFGLGHNDSINNAESFGRNKGEQ